MALGSFALLTGCSGSPAPPGKTGDDRAGASISAPARDTGALFQTDSLSYTLRYDGEFYETTIGVRFSNKTRATTYFENCDGQTSVALEKLVGGQWKPAWSPPVKLCFGPSIVVTPLNERDMPVHVFAGSSTAKFEPKLEVDTVPGVYRSCGTRRS